MQIRDEEAGDHEGISALITAAFAEAAHRDGNEAALVMSLRAAEALLLSLVAGEDGRLIGHIAASPCRIGASSGYGLIAPVSVLPARQGSGIGARLMRAALRRLEEAGCQGVALVGDPAWYQRFGFAAKDGLTCRGVPSGYVLSRGLACPAPVGALELHPAFNA